MCCETCLQYQASNIKETMNQMSHQNDHAWELVSTDLFSVEYLLIVDSCSQEIARLHSTSSKLVIEHIKSVFARHGIPRIVKSDYGPQYTSEEYKKFSEEWGFTHVTTSLYQPQANKLAEKSVQIVKRILKKINEILI